MSEITSSGDSTKVRGRYFFLSYAHSPPLDGSLEEDQPDPPNEWVRTFFRNLTDAVQLRASPSASLAPGFFDQQIPLGSDWKAVLSDALGTAEVFVPLFSPDYITKSWPGREWAAFEQRMKSAGEADPLSRFAPVLWIPLPAGQRPRGLREALDLAPVAALRAYRENGLRALLRLTPYQRLYQMIVDRLAAHIVELAEMSPIGPSPVPDIDQIETTLSRDTNAADFAVVVVAPASPDLPAGADRSAYGTAARAWRPFSRDQQLPLADYAQVIAEQLDFTVEVIDIEKAAGVFTSQPGVALIDPWYITGDERPNIFHAFVRELQPWALPVLVPSPEAARLNQQVKTSLEKSRISGSEPARRGLRGVTSLREFVNLMPFLVAQAEREYLRHGPIQRSAVPEGSRLGMADRDGPAPTSPWPRQGDPAEEKP